MIRIYVDYNHREGVDQIVLPIASRLNAKIAFKSLKEGDHVILEDEDLQCEAVLSKGVAGRWIGVIVAGTEVDLPPERWNRFRDTPV